MGCAGSVAVLPLGEAVEECSEYRLGKELGRGAFAVVYDAVSSVDGSKWAIKIMQPQEAQNCQGEMEIMRLAGKHANVVSLRDTFMCGAQTCLTLELVSGGELFDFRALRDVLSTSLLLSRTLCCLTVASSPPTLFTHTHATPATHAQWTARVAGSLKPTPRRCCAGC